MKEVIEQYGGAFILMVVGSGIIASLAMVVEAMTN